MMFSRTAPFRSRIRSAIADPNLQAALDANAARRARAREQAFASLPEPLADLRARAHAVRAETIAHLDEHLARFLARAEANGFIIHRARDATQARHIVLEIVEQARKEVGKDETLVVKSKSMLSEEVGVNHALEAAGHRVVETDLGEYIVQLRGERPSHIITPAVHLRRQDVARLFHEKLGLPYTEDVAALTAAARRELRDLFLRADVGISGVNFGVAESGSLCLLTNEGNGRMVTTLPPVHIALMGMERLVPTLDDLALMLALLPRSATGQKLTVYTTLIQGPRRPGEADGPRERHLILVDNGRSALRGSPLEEALYCIRCGACLNACPVFREIGGHAYVGAHGEPTPYPGPIGSVLSPALVGAATFGHLAQASTLCGACAEACPVAIDLPRLLLRVRSGTMNPTAHERPVRGTGVPLAVRTGLRLFAWAATHPRFFRAAQNALTALGGLLAPRAAWMRLPTFTGWGLGRDFPRPAARPLRAPQVSAEEMPGAAGQAPVGERSEEVREGEEQGGAVERFVEEARALGASVVLCSAENVAQEVLAFLQARGVSEVAAWKAEHLPAGLAETLREAGVRLRAPTPEVRVGLTGALGAVAETGTVIIPSGPGRPQRASLLPEVHLAVVRAADVFPDLRSALRALPWREAAMTTLVSGPSRTADIEMTLTIGVHGPGEVVIFLASVDK
ncbi:MAG: hypothetical protein D6770_03150 [Anaerolineae bacterium]|nr:MAG: hypothetical protein D6770_03150 [Anaerolineae bacterium]